MVANAEWRAHSKISKLPQQQQNRVEQNVGHGSMEK